MMPFSLGCVHYILFPLQGLFNFIAYIFPKVTKRLKILKPEGVANPKRFFLAFRDSVMSIVQVLVMKASRTRSRLLTQTREMRSPRELCSPVLQVHIFPQIRGVRESSTFQQGWLRMRKERKVMKLLILQSTNKSRLIMRIKHHSSSCSYQFLFQTEFSSPFHSTMKGNYLSQQLIKSINEYRGLFHQFYQ